MSKTLSAKPVRATQQSVPAPKWLKIAIAKGRTKEEFEVEGAA